MEEDVVHLANDPRELTKTVARLQNEILRLEAMHKERQNDLRNLYRRISRRGEEPALADDLLRGFKATEKQLLAESEVLRVVKPTAISNATLVDLALEKELTDTVDSLESLTKSARKQRSDLKATLERLDVVIDRDRRIVEALRGKTEEKGRQLDASPAERQQHRIQTLKANVRKVKSTVTEIWSELADFLRSHFPSVPENANHPDAASSEQSISTVADGNAPHRYFPITDIIQTLVNAHTSRPNNPYVKIEREWWPPYVKMLLQFGICVAHPQRPGEVRLESYS